VVVLGFLCFMFEVGYAVNGEQFAVMVCTTAIREHGSDNRQKIGKWLRDVSIFRRSETRS
jgi:hypothetical protein